MTVPRLASWLAAAALGSTLAPVAGSDGAPAGRSAAGESPRVASAPPVAEDPVERLRQRLAERLLTGRTTDAAHPLELRVSTRTPASPEAASKRPAAAERGPRTDASAAPAATTRKAAPPAPGTGAWSYEGATGPLAWASLRPEFALCGQGQRQSPIDLQGGLAVDLEPVRFGYQASRFGTIDTGRTLQVNVGPGNQVEIGGRRFDLKRIQFHRPAEHRIDGRSFEMSAHLVHEDADGRVAVVAVLLDPGPAQPALQALWAHIPLERHEEVVARTGFDPADLLPTDRRYFTYMGSLTTPPCSEGVRWVVMRTPVTMSSEQIDVFARIYPLNARPLQAAGGRRILQSN